MKILFLAANPEETTRLRLRDELNKIDSSLQKAGVADKFQLIHKWAVDSTALRRDLLDEKPDIVHFSGHGTGTEGLVLVGQDGKPKPATGDALGNLFKIVNGIKPVRCVLLNACYAEEQANAIYQHIDNVIGMRSEVKDDAAIAFATGFYDGLGRRLPIKTAFELGCVAIQFELATFSQATRKAVVVFDKAKEALEPIPDHLIPVLFSREPDSVASISKQKESLSEALKEEGITKEESLRQYRENAKRFLADKVLTSNQAFQLSTIATALRLTPEEANQILEEEKVECYRTQVKEYATELERRKESLEAQLENLQKAIGLPVEATKNVLETDLVLTRSAQQNEEIHAFLDRLLENFFGRSSLQWNLCFTGEDQSRKLGELIRDLRNGFSATGDSKRIPSGFSYWGIISTLAWESTCSDPLYPVMKEGSSSFNKHWKICSESLAKQKHHYVSLGVGTGDKDNSILERLYDIDSNVRYFPVDMSSTMLRLGAHEATKNIPLKGNNVLPIQIDFSYDQNIAELRNLLNEIDNDDPMLFSLLGNTLANFEEDAELLRTLSGLMHDGDKFLLEVATTQETSEEAAEAAAKEYENALSFKKFVTSALLEYTDLRIDYSNVFCEGAIELDSKALIIKVIYRNSTGQTILIRLPDWENVEFKPEDTIRLLTTRKYTSSGINKVISDSGLKVINRSSYLLEGRNIKKKYGFGMDLILLSKESK